MTPVPFGRYLLLDRINVGGMAEVFLAKSFGVEGFERLVAIKRILPALSEDDEFVAMFVEEARLSAQLSHPNIAPIHELGWHDGSYFIAMEYVSGRDLRAVLDRLRRGGRPMPVAEAAFVVARICDALDHAHRMKDAAGNELCIVHRDVSPQNVLLGFEGELKLIDFGVAKAAGRAQRTQAGMLKGKISYMSPEQVHGEPVDARSDIFAVGAILFECLTARRLFAGDGEVSTLEKVRRAEVPPPRSLEPAIPEALEAILLRTLSRGPAHRPQTAAELQDALMPFAVEGGVPYTQRRLAQAMRERFPAEIAGERERLRALAASGQGVPPPVRSARPGDLPYDLPEPTPPPRPAPAGLSPFVIGAVSFTLVLAGIATVAWLRGELPGSRAEAQRPVEQAVVAAPPPPAAPVPAPVPEARPEPPPPPAPVHAPAAARRPVRDRAPGFLIVNTRPPARVLVDGKDTGRWTPVAPAAPLELSPGLHRVVLRTAEGQEVARSVSVRQGETSSLAGIEIAP